MLASYAASMLAINGPTPTARPQPSDSGDEQENVQTGGRTTPAAGAPDPSMLDRITGEDRSNDWDMKVVLIVIIDPPKSARRLGRARRRRRINNRRQRRANEFGVLMKAVLQILKKNMISIILAVLVILSIVAKFYPLAGMYLSLQDQLNGRVSAAEHVEGLLSSQRHMPLLSPDQTDQAVLDVFPTQEVIDAGKAAIAELTEQADKLVQAAVQKNIHAPLFPSELPKPDDSTKYSFAQKYISETTNLNRWVTSLNSCGIPTLQDIADETAKRQATIFAQFGVVPGGTASPAMTQAIETFTQQTATLAQDMQLDRAKQYSIYMEPDALPFDATIGIVAGKLPQSGQIWDAQLQMWIVDDVTNAIARINSKYSDPDMPGGPPSNTILHSPIKRIEKLQTIAPILATSAGDLGEGVGSATPFEPTISPTGRVSNALYDAYRFDLSLVVDAAKIPDILRALQLDQFMTVLNVQILEVVDPAVAAGAGYRYGDKPVVRLEIDGEDLLMKNWTADLLPDSRKAAGPANGAPNQPNNNEDN